MCWNYVHPWVCNLPSSTDGGCTSTSDCLDISSFSGAGVSTSFRSVSSWDISSSPPLGASLTKYAFVLKL